MKNYRFVSQGEFYITSDENTSLVTCGMTECIALAFIDQTNPVNRMLAHIDGFILYDRETALANINKILDEFRKQSAATSFDVYMLGGQRQFRNSRVLLEVLVMLQIPITEFTDINEFCSEKNKLLKTKPNSIFSKVNPMSANATMICTADKKPDYVLFRQDTFDPPMSDVDLEMGLGLTDTEAQKEYALFAKINDKILQSNPLAARAIRTSADKSWVDEQQISLAKSSY